MRMEERYGIIVRGVLDAVIKPTQGECAHIDRAACWAENEDKPQQVFGVPALWRGKIFLIHAIPGDGDLGDVVEEVLNQYLESAHGAVWEPA